MGARAFKNGRITRPVPIALPPKPEGKEHWLSRRQVARILRAAMRSKKARSYLPLFILIAVYTGRRMSAILSLRWCQIDLERGLIDFNGNARVIEQEARANQDTRPALAAFETSR